MNTVQIGTPWLFVNDNYNRKRVNSKFINHAVVHTRAKMRTSSTWKDVVQIILWFVVYGELGLTLAYGFCNVP